MLTELYNMAKGITFHSITIQVLIYYTCLAQVPNTQYETPHRRFEYKYSFKGPYLAQKDGTVPFWEYEGNAIASDEMVRITPSLRSKKGSIWTKSPTSFEWWEVELWFRVSGRGRLGADGLAFWFTEHKGPDGPVFGAQDTWRGLGLFFDSFDNDAKGNNPYIMAMINDGSKHYDHQNDGSTQQLSGCLRDFRNKPFPVRAKIEYYRNTLTVLFHSGNTNNPNEYELCFRADNVYLPQHGYFGMSAATGGLADDHDVLKFLTYSLHPPGSMPQLPVSGSGIADAEKERFAKEYEQYKDKLEKQKEEYYRAHPEEAKKMREVYEMDPEHEYEGLGEKELQQIFNSQSEIFETIKGLGKKLDEVIGRQERTMAMINAVTTGAIPLNQAQQQGHPPSPAQAAGHMPIQRHEVESLLQFQQELVQNTRQMKQHLANQGAGGQQIHQAQPASIQQANSLSQQLMTETRDSINVLRKDFAEMVTKLMSQRAPQPEYQCPKTSDCLSTSVFVFCIFIHLAILLGYLIYKSSKDNSAKKFY